jgi:hypothetical protein
MKARGAAITVFHTFCDAILDLLTEGTGLGVVGLKLEEGLVELAGIVVVAELEVAQGKVEKAFPSPVWNLAVDV